MDAGELHENKAWVCKTLSETPSCPCAEVTGPWNWTLRSLFLIILPLSLQSWWTNGEPSSGQNNVFPTLCMIPVHPSDALTGFSLCTIAKAMIRANSLISRECYRNVGRTRLLGKHMERLILLESIAKCLHCIFKEDKEQPLGLHSRMRKRDIHHNTSRTTERSWMKGLSEKPFHVFPSKALIIQYLKCAQ